MPLVHHHLLALVRPRARVPRPRLRHARYLNSIAARDEDFFRHGFPKPVDDFETYEISRGEDAPSFWEVADATSRKAPPKKRSELFFELSHRLKGSYFYLPLFNPPGAFRTATDANRCNIG